MTSVAQAITNAAEQIQSGNAADLKQGLATIANLSKEQLTANQSSITYPLQMLTQAVDRNIKANSQEMTTDMNIRKLLQDTQKVLPDKMKRQLAPVIKNLEKQTQQAVRQGDRQKRKQEAQLANTKRQIQKQMNKTNEDVLKLDKLPKIFAPSQLSAVQQQIYQYQPILNITDIPRVTTPQNIPPTMQLLSRYAQIQGMKPIGSVSNQGGLSYVGVKQIQDETLGIKTFVPYQITGELQKKSIPSISMQLQYYASKTMNNWNKYIDSESQFVSFLSKVNTPTNRQVYMEKQFRTLNLVTFYAQFIATVSYYYIYLPMLRMASLLTADPTAMPTLNSFIQRYQSGNSRDLNPLLLTSGVAVQLVEQMFALKKKGPVQYGKKLIEILGDKFKNNLNKQFVTVLTEYPQKKKAEARQFMSNNGLQQSLIEQVLAAKDWSSVKKKRVIAGRGATNPYVAQMARRIVQQDNSDATKTKDVQFSWNQQQILAHDYVWGHSTKF